MCGDEIDAESERLTQGDLSASAPAVVPRTRTKDDEPTEVRALHGTESPAKAGSNPWDREPRGREGDAGLRTDEPYVPMWVETVKA